MIDTAISRKKSSLKSGAMPTMVVPAASSTGRRRLTQADIKACWVRPSSAERRLISSTMITQFLIKMPTRLSRPSIAGKVKDKSVTKSPTKTPTIMSGTVIQVTSICRTLPNSISVAMIITSRAIGKREMTISLANFIDSYSPPHSSS